MRMNRNDDELREFYTNEVPVSHPDDVLLRSWVARLYSGEDGPAADGIARYIIKDFQLRQFLGVPQSPVALEWIASALLAISEYEDPLKALSLLPRPKKRPADPQRGWDLSCWVAVAEKRGYTRAEAVKLAAEVFATDDSNVRKLLKNGPEWMNPDHDWAEYFLLRRRPLPPPQTGKK